MAKAFAALAIACLLAAPAWSDDAADEAAMGVLDEFMAAFNARDMDAWSATLNYPHVRFASGSVAVYADAAAFGNRDAFALLQKTGWDHSHWLSRDVVMSSPTKVHVNTVFQRFNTQNQPIGRYESLYIVTLVDGRWGIQARSSLAP